MVHDDDLWISSCLMSLDEYVDGIYVNLNNPTPICKKIIEGWPSVKKIIYTTNEGRWNQGVQRDNTIRMLDEVKPDIVLFPDSDETLPKNFDIILKDFIDSGINTLWFGLIYYWNHPNVARRDGRWKAIHHVRGYRWKPGITYIPYAGYTNPTTFINEKKLILNIGRRITNTGPLCNMDEGGRGSDTMSHHPRKKEIMRKSKRIGDKHFAYKKTYDELYGDRADEERIKRSMPLQGIQHSKERKENSRNGHLGQIPWNKGLTKETDVRVLKYAQNKISKNFIKKYKIEDIKTGEIFNFKGKKKLNCFIRKINKQYKWGCKINVDTLISQLKHRNFKIIIEE